MSVTDISRLREAAEMLRLWQGVLKPSRGLVVADWLEEEADMAASSYSKLPLESACNLADLILGSTQ